MEARVLNEYMTNTQLTEILEVLHRMDKRDRLRTWGGFFKSLLHLIPLILILWSTWFAYAHWDELLKEISKAAAESSAAVMQSQGSDFSKQMQEQMQKLMGQ
ncbi:MAG: hypothetical protein Greene101449_125 [Candidatus Peregrinibacteria bacterium Greene1014_49]|nr:MAG: hypothetical protein Greene101449_125 [Candidatus Peregrinibacteria bacterium Greene1014_49]